MANPYPAVFRDDNSDTRLAGSVDFTDPANQPGGSLPAPNWCLIGLDTPAPLVPSPGSGHSWSAAEMHILAQSGSDFSLGTFSGQGAVFSAGGGFFQVGAAIDCPAGPTLDAGSTALRWLWLSASIGPGPDLGQLGYDSLVPIFPTGTDNGPGAALQTVASMPNVVAPGGAAIWNPAVQLVGGVGTDSIPLNNTFDPTFGTLAVWQIG